MLCSFIAEAQSHDATDFLTGAITIKIEPYEQRIEGYVEYRFQTIENTNIISLDAQNMLIEGVTINGRNVRFRYDNKQLSVHKKLKQGKSYTLGIQYSCKPKQTVYFLGWNDSIENNEQIWTQGQGKYTSHWVPSFDDMREKVVFDISITFDAKYEVIANGKLKGVVDDDEVKTWQFDMQQPMSSYLLAFAIGKYSKKEVRAATGVPITLYYYPSDSLKSEPTYRYTSEIFQFLQKEIGVAYPWQNYKQIPVRDFLYAGMENTGTTLFSDAYITDSTGFADKNYVNVNAHEMAHQWFGNLVTEADAGNHWLHEGFATFYALLAEKELFGEEYYFWKLYDMAQGLSSMAREGRGEALTDPKAGSATFYEKGALALELLRHQMGEDVFQEGIKSFLNSYAFQNATVSDFTKNMERVSHQNLENFQKDWLLSTEFQTEAVESYLRQQAAVIDQWELLKKEVSSSREPNETVIERYWEHTTSSEFRKRILLQYYKTLSIPFLKKAFATGDLKIRQALALRQGTIPSVLKEEYESLLDDESYVTVENALYRLWVYFPDQRSEYLSRTKGLVGFSNKNIRILWLLLATLTREFEDEQARLLYRQELFGYTAPEFPMEVRQFAFGLIGEVFPYTDTQLKDLLNAAVHPSWQFRQFATEIIERLLKDDKQKERFMLLAKELNEAERQFLTKKLKEE